MTTSPTIPTNGAPAAEMKTFESFLGSHRAALAASITRDAAPAALPEPRRTLLAEQVVSSFVASFGDLGATAAWVGELLRDEELVALGERPVNEMFVGLRTAILEVALTAVVSGVPGAREAVHALMNQVNIAHVVTTNFFQARADAEMRMFRELFEHSPDAIVVARLDGTITHANAAFRRQTTLGEATIGVNLSSLGTSDPAAQRALEESMAAAGSWQGLIPYERSDGTRTVAHNTIFYIRDASGAPQAFATIMRDASDQLRREAELRAVNARLEQSLATTPLSTIEWDREGTVLRWNPAAERIFGWSAAEAIGRNIVQLLVPDVALDQVQAIIDALLGGEGGTSSRNLNIRKDGKIITCQWYNALLRDDQGNVIGALSQTEDVTEELKAEEALRSSQEQLIQAQQAALRELSTPLIPLADGVVAMPLIGAIDSSRAQLVIETLLEGVSLNHARVAILDITGVSVVDTQVANALIRAAQAVKLLGAQVILTGIRPEVAQTLVGLGVDLSGIVTRSSFQAGINFALTRG
jgi:rsbT co-antagonist protein RsbR